MPSTCPPCPEYLAARHRDDRPGPLRRLAYRLRTARRRRLLRDLGRRADWAAQARSAPTVRGWTAGRPD
jgi:hypothetical protein